MPVMASHVSVPNLARSACLQDAGVGPLQTMFLLPAGSGSRGAGGRLGGGWRAAGRLGGGWRAEGRLGGGCQAGGRLAGWRSGAG